MRGNEHTQAKRKMWGEVIECVISWICLFVGLITQNPNYLIASGAFAIATQIELYRKKGGD